MENNAEFLLLNFWMMPGTEPENTISELFRKKIMSSSFNRVIFGV